MQNDARAWAGVVGARGRRACVRAGAFRAFTHFLRHRLFLQTQPTLCSSIGDTFA